MDYFWISFSPEPIDEQATWQLRCRRFDVIAIGALLLGILSAEFRY